MTHVKRKYVLTIGLAAAGWLLNGGILPILDGDLVSTTEARISRPATPVSYTGVARRSTVGQGRGVLVLRPESEWGRGA